MDRGHTAPGGRPSPWGRKAQVLTKGPDPTGPHPVGISRMMWVAGWEGRRLNRELGNLVSTHDSTTNSRPRLCLCQMGRLFLMLFELLSSSNIPFSHIMYFSHMSLLIESAC